MKDVFFFNSMLTPKIITFVYWLFLLSALISGISVMFFGYEVSIIRGLMIIIFGAVGARIWCELMIVLFKIHENLQRIAEKSDQQ